MKHLEEKQKRTWEALFYSNQRIDLLLITISGAGIYVCLEALKYFNEKNIPISPIIKCSAVLLLSAIILNFISQWFSFKTHFFDYQVDDLNIANENLKTKDKHVTTILEKKSDCYSYWTNFTSNTSIISMFIGLILLLVFFLTTF